MKMQKIKKLLSIPKKKKNENENEDKDKNMLLEYIKDVDKKLFKKYSHSKDFNSFINEFDHATNKEDKEKIVKKLKEVDDIVHHYAEMENNSNEYKQKLFNIIDAIDYFLYQYSKKWVSNFN